MNRGRTTFSFIVFIMFAIVIAGAAFVYRSRMSGSDTYAPPVASNSTATPTRKTSTPVNPQDDLGSEVYEKTNNPVAEKLPDTMAQVPNPVEGVYKNPFD